MDPDILLIMSQEAYDKFTPELARGGTLLYDEDLAKTGKLLLDNNINGAGVLSGNDNLIGIISKTDIVKALAFLK